MDLKKDGQETRVWGSQSPVKSQFVPLCNRRTRSHCQGDGLKPVGVDRAIRPWSVANHIRTKLGSRNSGGTLRRLIVRSQERAAAIERHLLNLRESEREIQELLATELELLADLLQIQGHLQSSEKTGSEG